MSTILDPYNFQPMRPHRAVGHRRMRGIMRTSRNSTSVNLSDGRQLEQITHDLMRNHPLVESYLSGWTANTVGTGIWPIFQVEADDERAALRRLLQRSMREIDADGRLGLGGLTALVSRSVASDGEVFARFRPRRIEDGFAVPLQIQLISAAQLPRSKTTDGAEGNTVRGGIERNGIGRRVAYHFYRRHPGEDSTLNSVNTNETVRVPASEVLHIGLPKSPGELRHVSQLVSGLLSLKGMLDTDDNTMERLRVASLFTALYSTPFDDNSSPAAFGEEPPDDEGVSKTSEFGPGMVNQLPDGASVFFPPAPDVGSAYLDFMQTNIKQLAAMLGITYPELSGDFSRITLSSMRVAVLVARRRHDYHNEHCLINQFLAPVMRRWVRTAVLSGAISLPGYRQNPDDYDRIWYKGQRRWYVDPAKDQAANSGRLDDFTAAPSEFMDGDPDLLVAQIREDHDRLRAAGLSFGGDPRHVMAQPTEETSGTP